MAATLLLYWFPLFIGVGFGARLVSRRSGTVLGALCALFWIVLVQVNTGGEPWRHLGPAVCVLLGAAAIAALGCLGAAPAARPWGQREPAASAAPPIERSEPGGGGLRHFGLVNGARPQLTASMLQNFDDWLEVHRFNDDPWADFEEFIRSALFQWVGATNVSTFRVLSEGDELIPLHELSTCDPEGVISARHGVEGYVATTGRSFVKGDPTHGRLVNELRGVAEDERGEHSAPAWCFAVVRGARKIGVITTGRFEPSSGGPAEPGEDRDRVGPWTPVQLRPVELLLARFWNELTEVCRSRAAVVTDLGSGCLTRRAFFEVGREVLADACRRGEPVALAVIGMEGIRGLDDEGSWDAADEIRAVVSGVLRQRLRADDRLGRFDDSRFVLLLRRVDSELASLIVKELMRQLAAVTGTREGCDRIEVRCGLAGSGVIGEDSEGTALSLERLVSAGLEQCRQARIASVAISSDLADGDCGLQSAECGAGVDSGKPGAQGP